MEAPANASGRTGTDDRFGAIPGCAFLLVSAMLVVASAGALAAESDASALGATSPQDPLAAKQRIVRDRMAQLEDRMFRLTERLAASEPAQAERVREALQRARALLVRQDMGETIALLEKGDLTGASDRELIIVKNLEEVLETLLEDPDGTERRRKEIEQLDAFRDEVESMLNEERELKARADAVPRLQQLTAAIQGAIARLDALIAREQEEIDKTSAAARGNNKAAAGGLSGSQKQTRLEAESLAEDLGQALPPAPEGEPPSGRDHGPGEDHDPEAQEPTAGEDKPAEAKIEADIRKAQGKVETAAGQMQAAENELAKAALAEAVPMQTKARESLERALEELKRQEKNVTRLIDQAEAARKQRELEKRAGQLAGQMGGQSSGQEPKGGGQQGGDQQGGNQQSSSNQGNGQQGDGNQPGDAQQGGGKQGGSQPPKPPAPGTDNVKQAGRHMDAAAGDLEGNKPAEAAKDEQQAIDELEKALDELQQALDQLRQEQREEILRGLEARFRAMLARQVTINTGTEVLEDKGRDAWTHADQLNLAELAGEEQGLAKEAAEALHILEEEGTTIVFPQIVEQLQEDMQAVAGRLGDGKTGPETLRMEADIVTTLEELIEAVKQLQNDGQGGGGGGGGGGNPPLLPDSAELKLLRSCQQRVNKQTLAHHAAWTAGGGMTPELEKKLDRVAERQRELAEMARKMSERVAGQ